MRARSKHVAKAVKALGQRRVLLDVVAEHLSTSANGWAYSGSVGQHVTELAVFAVAQVDRKPLLIPTDWIAAQGFVLQQNSFPSFSNRSCWDFGIRVQPTFKPLTLNTERMHRYINLCHALETGWPLVLTWAKLM